MKPLPPTLRENRRYVLARIDPPWFETDSRTLYEALAETVTALYGDTGMARIQPAVISVRPGYAIFRCIRSTEADLLAALAAVNHAGPQKVAIRSLRTSGTLLALRRAIGGAVTPPATETGEARFQGKTYASIRYQIEKVDLFENGFKSQELLFLTAEDLEE